MIRAIVALAKLSNVAAAEQLTTVIVERRDELVTHSIDDKRLGRTRESAIVNKSVNTFLTTRVPKRRTGFPFSSFFPAP
jgi:hypothetical protein